MKIRSLSLTVLSILVLASTAAAEPGAAFVEAPGGVLIHVGSFSRHQDYGGAYSIAAGYEFLPFLDGMLEFTRTRDDECRVHVGLFEGSDVLDESLRVADVAHCEDARIARAHPSSCRNPAGGRVVEAQETFRRDAF